MLDYPFGLYLVQLTADLVPMSAEYYEKCMYAGGTKSMDANQNVVIENFSIVCSRIVPASPTIIPTAQSEAFDIQTGNGQDQAALSDLGPPPTLAQPQI
jgi:hypothetical protein